MREIPNPYQAPQSGLETPSELGNRLEALYQRLKGFETALSNFDDKLVTTASTRNVEAFRKYFEEAKLSYQALHIVHILIKGVEGIWGIRKWKSREEIGKHRQHIIEKAKKISAKKSTPASIEAHGLGLYDLDVSLQHNEDWDRAWDFVMGKI